MISRTEQNRVSARSMTVYILILIIIILGLIGCSKDISKDTSRSIVPATERQYADNRVSIIDEELISDRHYSFNAINKKRNDVICNITVFVSQNGINLFEEIYPDIFIEQDGIYAIIADISAVPSGNSVIYAIPECIEVLK